MLANPDIHSRFASLTTPTIADACVRGGVAFAAAPSIVRPVIPGARCAGRALPVTHFGSVDVFLEAMDRAEAGDVLVIDNDNRQGEACIGDLTVIEAKTAGIAGVVLWGAHRDTAELLEIGLPVFTTGTMPVGPLGVRPRTSEPLAPCHFAGFAVTRDHIVFADMDGVLFVPGADVEAVLSGAQTIATTERRQADRVRAGTTLRAQLQWDAYLAARRDRPGLTLREHLAAVGGAIEV